MSALKSHSALGGLLGPQEKVLSAGEALEQLTARSLLALRKAHAAPCLLSCSWCCMRMTSLVLEVRGKGRETREGRRTQADNQKWRG